MKLNKFLVALLCIILLFCVSSCSSFESALIPEDEKMFVVLPCGNPNIQIFVHKETRVMYLFCKSGYGVGLTVMLDENGYPLLYEGDLDIEN